MKCLKGVADHISFISDPVFLWLQLEICAEKFGFEVFCRSEMKVNKNALKKCTYFLVF